ncbi:(2Fe-2S) ferredoxin domain-containing protein [Aquimarina sp. 2201CG5-10]|uniref:(2Fe-2S) ferredoxin domain-containing protein n=1 Tax=Aquimarina callyspongiae TaxID=3098150 RepID=UPI002AB5243F|nr:(2Fe-2S) ferredoxin domain-containing protein [Aquimarina sp. 2201CG5-10]MDY8136612.1 (2Fe-2S) ferredoxin domain-containing protein [Aquimarina sp. 2201CG5-10]
MGKNIPKVSTTFQFCDGGSCRKAKSEIAIREARAYLRNQELWDETHTIKTRCNGRCEDAPTWIVQPGNFWYKNLTPEKAVTIIKSHTVLDQPAEDYLLYQEGWSSLLTENEKTVALPVFKNKVDEEHGDVLVARAFASDQHLYPLFQYLFQEPKSIAVQQYDEVIEIKTVHQVDYSDDYEITIMGQELQLRLTIAGIPKDISEEIADRKVSISEVIWLKKRTIFTKAIRLKNKKGKHLVTFWIKEEDHNTWAHILKVYLSMSPDQIRIEDEH